MTPRGLRAVSKRSMARQVYRLDDERARLKNEVNAAAGCALGEVKEHPGY